MPGVDWIPGISQLKAGVQLLTGDIDGAAETSKNFLRECPGVSQVTSVVQVVAGDTEGALETQKRCLGTINNVANGIPVVGHAKGVVHHFCGDAKGRDKALNAANRSTVVMASGAAAGLATGGLCAIPAAIAAGGAYDITASIVTEKPQGFVAAMGKVIDNPSAVNILEAAMIPVGDGLAGYNAGEFANTLTGEASLSALEAARAVKTEELNSAMFDGTAQGTTAQLTTLGKEINSLTGQINTIKHGTPQYWYDAKGVDAPVQTATITTIPGYIENENVQKENNVGFPPPCNFPVHIKDKHFEKRTVILQERCVEQEKGFDTDIYINEDRRTFVQRMKRQNVHTKWLKDVYPNTRVVTRDKIKDLMKEFEGPNILLKALLDGCWWLYYERRIQAINSATSANGAAAPLVGYNEEKFRDLYPVRPNGFDADLYIYEYKVSPVVQALILQKFQQQVEDTPGLQTQYPNMPVLTREEMLNLRRDFSPGPKCQLKLVLAASSWLHVRMPDEFNYTGAISRNRIEDGLLHSFLRHWDQWGDFIPTINGSQLLSVFQQYLNNIKNAQLPSHSSRASRDFRNELRNLTDNDFIQLQDILNGLQLDMHQFIQNNVTYGNYLGEGTSDSGLPQVYFEVRDLHGNVWVMVVGISPDLRPDDFSFNDRRPVRTITTIYFITMKKYLTKNARKHF